ncbi:3-phytase A [Podospora fimiseda]|uniref:3-phytase n=1 Tax=Podospora fimiseda TaxID=252190 RepID=A0AAN7H1Z4_9PEZI|nr:3-phytase A [Podospora fimiseda]
MSPAKPETAGYAPVQGDDTIDFDNLPAAPPRPKGGLIITRRDLLVFLLSLLISLPVGLLFALIFNSESSSSSCSPQPSNKVLAVSNDDPGCVPTTTVPQYFQTSPELWAGPTATGKAPFLAQTQAWDSAVSYVPNQPLQTGIPVEGMGEKEKGIFGMMGYLTPYRPSEGFGVDEWPLPKGAEIVQLQMVSRHGSRYPTEGSVVQQFGEKVNQAKEHAKFKGKGALEFLNEWRYELGSEILVSKGRQELFDSGVLHSYMYGKLYNPNSKIIVRTTTQDRMLKSAENFMAGFFGLEWTNNATIEVIIEGTGYNNSLAGYMNCPNGHKVRGGTEAANIWIHNYLQNATARLSSLVEGFEWTIEDSYAAQTMCSYETVAYGFSRFCSLFDYDEWIGFGYSIDLNFYGNDAFGSPVGRAIGLGYQQEVIARLRNHTLGYSGSQINTTLDGNTETFPLDQDLYLDFSHDTNIISILTAFGLRQFAGTLDPTKYPGPHNFTVSDLTPFGARLDIEIIEAPKPIKADRSGYEEGGDRTKYVHFVLNQRTVPLGWSLPECDASRVDGWCELDAFLVAQQREEGLAGYERACHGEYEMQPYGMVVDGRPIS